MLNGLPSRSCRRIRATARLSLAAPILIGRGQISRSPGRPVCRRAGLECVRLYDSRSTSRPNNGTASRSRPLSVNTGFASAGSPKNGRPTRHTCVVSFAPGSIFAFVRWASNDFGTIISRVAVAPGEPCSTLPFVRPRGEILVRIVGWPKVSRVFRAIDQVEMVCVDPADAARGHWRHVHNRLTAGEEPRPYTSARHNAWLMRRGSAR